MLQLGQGRGEELGEDGRAGQRAYRCAAARSSHKGVGPVHCCGPGVGDAERGHAANGGTRACDAPLRAGSVTQRAFVVIRLIRVVGRVVAVVVVEVRPEAPAAVLARPLQHANSPPCT